MKICRRCNQSKDESDFSPHKRMKDGLQSWCKDCRRDVRKNTSQIHHTTSQNTSQLCDVYITNTSQPENTSQIHHEYITELRDVLSAYENIIEDLYNECSVNEKLLDMYQSQCVIYEKEIGRLSKEIRFLRNELLMTAIKK